MARPLSAHELRIQGPDGRWWVWDGNKGTASPEIPATMNLTQVPMLVSMSDQGPVNTAALNFLQYSSQAIMLHAQWDCFHRAWNDIKLACKKSSCRAWKVVLQLTLVANLAYGPFGTSQFFYKKVAKMQEFLATRSVDCTAWLKYVHLICREQRREEPRTKEDMQALFQSLQRMSAFQEKGPLIKLMRWFSWFESMCFLDGQMWVQKMVLEESLAGHPEAEESGDDALPQEKDPAQELQQLKKKKGAWRLCPSLITEHSLCVKDCVMAVGKSTWKHHAARAREITSPMQVLGFNVSCAGLRISI